LQLECETCIGKGTDTLDICDAGRENLGSTKSTSLVMLPTRTRLPSI